ncbi:ABC transporter permease subunit, partial [Escherichia coli]|nr:ABC transporter permease subunit [Escherichia coli]
MFDGFLAPRYIGWMIDGLGVTLGLSALASVIALALWFVLCVLRLSPSRPVAGLAAAWLSAFRNTPLLVQLFFWYFVVSALLPDS